MNLIENDGFTINRVLKIGQTYKYMILKPKGGELLTLVSDTSMLPYHAHAVSEFMQANNIDEVTISGGGKLISYSDCRYYTESSGSFGSCSVHDIFEANKAFIDQSPEKVVDKRVRAEGHLGKPISENGGKTYSMKDIEIEVRTV